jgi:hypothetical protein
LWRREKREKKEEGGEEEKKPDNELYMLNEQPLLHLSHFPPLPLSTPISS